MMVGMVMVIITILRLGMLKMLKMIAYEMTMMAIMMRKKTICTPKPNFKIKKKLTETDNLNM